MKKMFSKLGIPETLRSDMDLNTQCRCLKNSAKNRTSSMLQVVNDFQNQMALLSLHLLSLIWDEFSDIVNHSQ